LFVYPDKEGIKRACIIDAEIGLIRLCGM